MSWEQKARLLREAGVAAPSSPPSEFTLSPHAPYRVPGGYLTMYRFSIAGTAGSVPPTWRPDLPSPTGSAEIGSHNETRIHLARVRPNTQYLLDLSVDSSSRSSLAIRECGGTSGTLIAEFPVSGPQHVFIVMPTDATGNGCVGLVSRNPMMTLLKVEVSELGPVR